MYLSIEDQLLTLAREPQFEDDYFNLNLVVIPDLVFMKLDSEVRSALIDKFSKYKKKEYVRFCQRLMEIEMGRL